MTSVVPLTEKVAPPELTMIETHGLETMLPAQRRLPGTIINEAELLEYVTVTPDFAGVVAVARPELIPDLLAAAYVRVPGTAAAILSAAREEYMRTLGAGDTATRMFHASLRVRGPAAPRVRADFQMMIAARDERVPAGTRFFEADEQANVMAMATRDAASGQFYGAFQDAPAIAIAQLADERITAPTEFNKHISQLSSLFVQNRPAGREFLKEVARERVATELKIAVITEVHQLIAADLAQIQVVRKTPMHLPEDVRARVEQYIPGLAALVSEPKVIEALYRHSKRSAQPGDETPPMDALLEEILLSSYSDATKMVVRSQISTGADGLIDEAAAARDPNVQSMQGEAAGAFLGAAVRAERRVGIDPTVWKQISQALSVGSEVLGLVDKAGPYVKAARVGMKWSAKLIEMVAGNPRDPEWTRSLVDQMLRSAYEEHYPPPASTAGEETQRQYDAEFLGWRRVAAQSFLNEFRDP